MERNVKRRLSDRFYDWLMSDVQKAKIVCTDAELEEIKAIKWKN